MRLDKLDKKLKRDFLAAIANDPKLDAQAFLNRVCNSIENNGVEFTAEIYDLTEALVEAIADAEKSSITLIEVNGIFIDTKEQFTADAAVGQWDGVSNDEHIFYWFDDFDMVIGEHPDFIITSYGEV
jgi:hypothetical protein